MRDPYAHAHALCRHTRSNFFAIYNLHCFPPSVTCRECNGSEYLSTQCYLTGLACGNESISNENAPFDVNNTVLTTYQCGLRQQGFQNASSIVMTNLTLHCNGTECYYDGLPCDGEFANEASPESLNKTIRAAYYGGNNLGRSINGAMGLSAAKSWNGVPVMLLLFFGIFASWIVQCCTVAKWRLPVPMTVGSTLYNAKKITNEKWTWHICKTIDLFRLTLSFKTWSRKSDRKGFSWTNSLCWRQTPFPPSVG